MEEIHEHCTLSAEDDTRATVMVDDGDKRAWLEIEAGGLTVSLFVDPHGCARLGALLTRAARTLGVAS
jgi:hypothetical protein